ncbi:MAG: LLM class flavin-dependent oxidoreductase [Acidobacteria bacterium]|nr:LLM class flavin-dependent oxidoreductase [Acidobacteriota bacterium]
MTYDIELNSGAYIPSAGIVELAPLMEEAGFGAFWKGESNTTDPMVLLCGMATRTRTLQLGTAIYHIYGRSPVALGIQAATLQDLSGGRHLLGLGVANQTVAAWHGGDFDRPLRRIREYLEIVRKTAAGERVEYDGEIYRTGRRFQLCWKPSRPIFPIFLAALGPQMSRLAGRIADGVFLNFATPAKIREAVASVRSAAAEAGRDPKQVEIVTKVRVALNPDRALARARLRQVLAFYSTAAHYTDFLKSSGFEEEITAIQQAFRQGGVRAAREQVTDTYMDKLPAIAATTLEEVRERLRPIVEAGLDRAVISYIPATEPALDDARRFVQAWAKAS